ncbi:MAG: DUF2971 domain-containing protein [Erysipelotrichaceae bacterium]|nr:DUF2971 domain-containing protein [Clostridia bacterium]MBQ6217674.1 DUF2971 domain-containing protein [Erysipelotrichaceae bacterium]
MINKANEKNDYLYHYTSLENLALILKNRTIRFSPLSKVDDLQESRSKDLKNIGRFVFVSCWTDENKESIPMWKMYGSMESGVRVGLPKNPFVRQKTTKSDLEKIFGHIQFKNELDGEESIDTLINMAYLVENSIYSPEMLHKKDILNRINYTDKINLLEPKTVFSDCERTLLDFEEIGIYKNMYWEFQKEWRYLIHIYPLKLTSDAELNYKRLYEVIDKLKRDELISPIDHYDFEISPEAYKKMIITKSPRLSPGNEILLSSLVDKYNSDAFVAESVLKGMV